MKVHKHMQYIFGQWLSNSNYEVDQRAHFEVLGTQYKLNNEDRKRRFLFRSDWVTPIHYKTTIIPPQPQLPQSVRLKQR